MYTRIAWIGPVKRSDHTDARLWHMRAGSFPVPGKEPQTCGAVASIEEAETNACTFFLLTPLHQEYDTQRFQRAEAAEGGLCSEHPDACSQQEVRMTWPRVHCALTLGSTMGLCLP